MTSPKSSSKSESPKKKTPNPREVEWSDSLRVAVEKLAFGNAKAGALLARIVGDMQQEAISFLRDMSKLNLYGESIIDGFELACHRDRDWFVACVITSDQDFLRQVEREKIKRAAAILKVGHLFQ